MKVRYVGPHDAVEVIDSQGVAYTAENGHQVELPDELAKSLLKQETWESGESKPAKKEGK